MNKQKKILSLLTALVLASLACNLPGVGSSGPDPTEESVPVSTEEAENFVEAWEQAFETARETGVVSLTLTEEQMTSFLAVSLAEQENTTLTDPQVFLREGEMEIVGKYDTGPVTTNAGVVLEISVDAEGKPLIKVISGSLGPLPLPAEILNGISQIINQSLSGQIASAATGFTLESIVISEGTLTMSGTLK